MNKDITSVIAAIFFAPFMALVQKYLINDLHLLINVFVLVVIDTIFGIILAYKLNKISSSGFGKLIKKMLIYILIIIAMKQGHINHPESAVRTLMEWVDGWVYAAIIIRELLSIFENAAMLGYFNVPKIIKEKLELIIEEGPEVINKEKKP